MKIDGHCHCGQISFEAEVDPASVVICHCADCQMLSGTAYRATIPAPATQFVILSGKLNIYIKTAESGSQRRHGFCGTCGTPIYACAIDNPQVYNLRVGTVTQRAELSLRKQIWRRSALHWVDMLAGVPSSEKG